VDLLNDPPPPDIPADRDDLAGGLVAHGDADLEVRRRGVQVAEAEVHRSSIGEIGSIQQFRTPEQR